MTRINIGEQSPVSVNIGEAYEPVTVNIGEGDNYVKDQARDVLRSIGSDEEPDDKREDEDLGEYLTRQTVKGVTHIAHALDYMGNISRSAIKGYAKGDLSTAGRMAMEAARNQRVTYAEDLRKIVASRLGMKKHGFNRGEGFDAGDVADFVMDVGIDWGTDPMTLLTFGIGGAVKSAAKKASAEAIELTGEKLIKKTGKLAEKRKKALAKKAEEAEEFVGPRTPFQAAEQKAARRELEDLTDKLKNFDELGPEDRLKISKELGILKLSDELRLQKAADAAVKATGAKGQLAQEMFTNTMVGLYTASHLGDEDSDVGDMLRNFGAGFVGTAVGRGVAKKYLAEPMKRQAAKIGRGLDKMASATKKVPMQVRNRVTGEAKDIQVPEMIGADAANVLLDATQGAKVNELAIRTPLMTAFKKIREGEFIDDILEKNFAGKNKSEMAELLAADTFIGIKHLEDKFTQVRNEIWDDKVRSLPTDMLKKYGLAKEITIKKKGKPKTKLKTAKYGEAQGIPAVRALREEVDDEAAALLFDADGRLNERARELLVTKFTEERTEPILRNINEWQDASKKSMAAEIEAKGSEYKKMLDEEGVFSGPELLKMRRDAIKNLGKKEAKVTYADMLSESDVDKAFRMEQRNKGMPLWSPAIGEKGMAIAKAQSKQSKMNVQTRQRARDTITRDMKRKVLSKKEAREYMDDMESIDKATHFLNSAEQGIDAAVRTKARNTLNAIQKEAGAYMGDVLAGQTQLRKAASQFNQLMKQGLLTGSLSWVKNNYWSNARQAFAKHGIMGALDATGMTSLHNGLAGDLRKIFFSDPDKIPPFMYKNQAEIDDMFSRGILEPTHFKDVLQREGIESDIAEFLQTPETRKLIKEAQNQPLARAMQKLQDGANLMGRKILHTQQTGAYVEGLARASTYQRTLKGLRASDNYRLMVDKLGKEMAEETIRRKATDVTNDVFFDYGKLTHFERTFMRSLFPFYSFYKQNLSYQTKALLNPEVTPKLAMLARMGDYRYFGSEPMTEEQKKMTPPWLSTRGAVRYEDPKTGKPSYRFSGSDPGAQAYQMLAPEYWFKGEFLQQTNPILKGIAEQLMNYDTMSGQPLDPKAISDDPNQQLKYIFSKGYPLYGMFQIFNDILDREDSPIHLDRTGNPVTDSELMSRMSSVMSWLTAQYTGTVFQVGGQIGKVITKRQSPTQAGMNILGPWQETQVLPELEARRIREIEEEEREELLEEERAKIRKARGWVPEE